MGFDRKSVEQLIREQGKKVAEARGEAPPPKAVSPHLREALSGQVIRREPFMNKLETAYAAHLLMLERSGRIRRWYAKPFNVRPGDDRYYRPDFAAIRSCGKVVVIETKGWLRDDAREKFKEAVARWPDWDFLMIQKDPQSHAWKVIMRSEGCEDL